MITRKLILTLAACAAMAAHAGEVRFSYAAPDADGDCTGTGSAISYDVAIKLAGAEFAGAKVTAMSVPVPQSANLTDFKVWLSSALTLTSSVNAPDLFSADVTVSNGLLQYTFAQPVTVGSNGLFVGYSFKVTKVDAYTSEPVLTARGSKSGALWIHGGFTWRKWTDVSSTYSQVSKMTVTLSGTYSDYNVTMGAGTDEIAVTAADTNIKVPVTLTNCGTYGSKSLEISYSYNGGAKRTVSAQLPAARSLYKQPYALTLSIPNDAHLGDNVLSLSVDKVNGSANTASAKSANVNILYLNEIPVNRPLIEEYTGLWCGYCPRGMAAMEYMTRKYPDDWIGVALHASDNMAIFSGAGFPNNISSYPSAVINRTMPAVDPYYGSSDGEYTIEQDWLEIRSRFTPFDISVTATRDVANPAVIQAEATVKVVKDMAGDYRLFYYLVADGVHNEEFVQYNGYAGDNPARYSIPEMRQFCEGGGYLTGLKFNDVPVMASAVKGIEGSLPATLGTGTPCTHAYTFNTTGVKSLNEYDLIGSASQLHVVAGVVDYATGRVMNTAKYTLAGQGGIGDIVSDVKIVSRRVYDLTGCPTTADAPGLKIVRTLYSNGTTTTAKIR